MARSFRRRRLRGRWLETAFNPGNNLVNGFNIGGTINVIPILRGNAPFGNTTTGNPLGQLQQFTHLRTVGDAYYAVSWAPAQAATASYAIHIHTGICVMSVDEGGAPLEINRWDPQLADATDMQWLFKRTYSFLFPAGAGQHFVTDNQSPCLPLGSWVDCRARRAMREQTDLFWVESFAFETTAPSGTWVAGLGGLQPFSASRGLHFRSYLRFAGLRR